jgi:hypothetical protein
MILPLRSGIHIKTQNGKRPPLPDPFARNYQNQIIPMFTQSLNVCASYVEEPFIYQSYTILALPFSLVISVKERMKAARKLLSRASVVRAGVTGFVCLSFCLHTAKDRDKPAFDEPAASILQT